MTKTDLSDKSGISISFLSDLTTGNANPSLKVMEAIASALAVPLPLLLENTDMSTDQLYEAGFTLHYDLPQGYERISVILPEHRAFIVKKWGTDCKQALDIFRKKTEK